MTARAFVRQADEGRLLWFAGGGVFQMKATAEETGGSFVLFEDRMVRGKATPLHLHPDEDEAIYVLEGELLAHFESANHPVRAGGFFLAPRGVPHAFLVTSESARILALQAPGTGWSFYEGITDPVDSDDDADRPADWQRLRHAAEQSPTIELLGPPPFDREFVQGASATS